MGGNLVGSGVVNGKIAAGYGSTINATGNLTLGDSTSPVGFVSNGELYTNANTVTLNSSNAANNKNAVVLGSLTQIDGGSLVAPNGILLDSGNNLVTTDAGGTVSGGTASRFLNNGNVQGPSSASGNWLTFNLLFKGGTGQTSGRIAFLDGFATGDCPGVNTQYGATELGGSGHRVRHRRNNARQFGQQLRAVEHPHQPQRPERPRRSYLSPGTSMKIVDWNGFVPTPGETFTVLTWDGTFSGTASLTIDPAFAADGIQFVPQWNSNSLAIEAVPGTQHARASRRRRHQLCRLRFASQGNEKNCEANGFRPRRRPAHSGLPVAFAPGERGTKGSLIEHVERHGCHRPACLRVAKAK